MATTRLSARQTMAEEMAEELRRQILTGELALGAPLPQTQLAAQFGTSTTPVREALRILRRDGLIIGESHQRVVVFRPTLDDLQENSQIRIVLERLATDLAVPRLTGADFRELRRLLEAMAATSPTDAVNYPPLNRQFHMTIYQAANTPRLLTLIEELRNAAVGYLRIFANATPDATGPQREHEAIYDACLAGNPDKASALMAEHLRHTLTTVSAQLEKSGSARQYRPESERATTARTGPGSE